MDIMAPISSRKEAEILKKAGATEFFFGYIDESWIQTFGKQYKQGFDSDFVHIAPNKRPNLSANITKKEDVYDLADFASDGEVKLFSVLNTFFYPDIAYPLLKKHLDVLYDAGIYGLIVTDVAMIEYIHKNYPRFHVVLSCCNQVANSYAASFFKGLGVKRITLPRHISMSEIKALTKNGNSDMEFECFVFDGRCIFDDGNCKILHNLGHFCHEQWEYDYYSTDSNRSITSKDIAYVRDNECRYKQWIIPELSDDLITNRWNNLSCVACVMPYLRQLKNLTTLKIAGRGVDVNTKYKLVKMTKKIIELSTSEDAERLEREYICKALKREERCQSHERCLIQNSWRG